jgi:hypothetical protein
MSFQTRSGASSQGKVISESPAHLGSMAIILASHWLFMGLAGQIPPILGRGGRPKLDIERKRNGELEERFSRTLYRYDITCG